MKEFFADANAGLIGLFFFFVFFCAIIVWTFRPGAKKQYQDQAQIPLEEDNKDE